MFQTSLILKDPRKFGYRENQPRMNPLPVILLQMNHEKPEHRELKKFLLPVISDLLSLGRLVRTGFLPRPGHRALRAERARDR